MKLQVAVDLTNFEQAMNLLTQVVPYVDIIEAGTPLIKQEGLKVVEAFKKNYPDKLIFADMKTMDAGELEAEIAFQAGADITSVLAVANNATIKGATIVARKYNKEVTADLIGVSNYLERAKELEKIGVDCIELHCGLDEQAQGLSVVPQLKTIRNQVKIILSVAGGINENTIGQVKAAGTDIVVVGGAIYKAQSPAEVARRLREKVLH